MSTDVTFFEFKSYSDDSTPDVESLPLPSVVDLPSAGAMQDIPANQEVPLPL